MVRLDQCKVLVLDVETTPLIAYVWGLRDQNIGLNQIKDDWAIMAWSAKWLGDAPGQIMYRDQRNAKNIYDDKKILLPLWKLLNDADIVITQNGQSFDGPRLNARFILHGMRPPSPYKHLDTYRLVKRVANFTSNKLEYLTDKLCTKYKKIQHSNFPGMSLWRECLNGNKEAWKEMERYNTHDVLSTEELYLRIRAWAPATMPRVYDIKASERKCPVCGERRVQQRGVQRRVSGSVIRLQCQSCGHWFYGEKLKEAA